jgi:hypothetical protein
MASAPPGRYTVTNGAVYDRVSTLTWQQTPPAQTYVWSDAAAYCQALTLAGWSSGWRLPTVKELASIVDFRAGAPSIDSAAFPATSPTAFWSATPLVGAPTEAFVVYFDYGEIHYVLVTTLSAARCVHS